MTVKEQTESATQPNSQSRPAVSPRLIWIGVFCILCFLADFTYTKHPHLKMQGWIAVNAMLGLFGVCVLVLVAKFAQVFLARSEEDYDV